MDAGIGADGLAFATVAPVIGGTAPALLAIDNVRLSSVSVAGVAGSPPRPSPHVAGS